MPRDVRVHIDHSGHDRQLSEIVRRVRRVSGLDRRDFGSLYDDGRVPECFPAPVNHGRGVNPDGLALRQQGRGGQQRGKQSGIHSHGADYNPRTRSMVKTAFAALLVAGTLASAALVRGVRLQPDREQDWPFYGGDQGGTKYSPLADVNASNVSRLQAA